MNKKVGLLVLKFLAIYFTIYSCKKEDHQIPSLTTQEASSVSTTTAETGGLVSSGGNSEVTERGVSWSTTANPTINDSKTSDGSGSGIFTSTILGLTANTAYYVRAYATNSNGTAYGNQVTFKTKEIPVGTGPTDSSSYYNPNLTYDSIIDIIGNNYKTIKIGAQVWMAENLRTTKYNDGEPIPLVTDNTAWSSLTTSGYSWYNNDRTRYENYGAIYNWYAVSGKLCPIGWRVPSYDDYNDLLNSLGSDMEEGGRMKEAGISHWYSPNIGATNSSGWTGLPGGFRKNDGSFVNLHSEGNWWTITQAPNNANAISAYLNTNMVLFYFLDWNSKKSGCSVRCIKD
jgi:uncharacterized protein (TIGR02145 family)